jgi:hypothetical protein
MGKAVTAQCAIMAANETSPKGGTIRLIVGEADHSVEVKLLAPSE